MDWWFLQNNFPFIEWTRRDSEISPTHLSRGKIFIVNSMSCFQDLCKNVAKTSKMALHLAKGSFYNLLKDSCKSGSFAVKSMRKCKAKRP